jgi:HK97 family phage prohead protease
MDKPAAFFEYKDCFMPTALQVKDVDTTGRRVQFYVAAYGNVDSHGDIILPGAFTKTLKENGPGAGTNRLRHLKDHMPTFPLGPIEEATDAPDGLILTSKVSKTSYGNDVLELETDGVYEHSIGYRTIKSQSATSGYKELVELALFEGSSVTWGSNPNTPTLGIKSQTPAEQGAFLQKQLGSLEKHLRTGSLTDETCQLLCIQILQIKQSISDLLTTSLSPQAGEGVHLEKEEPTLADLLTGFKSTLKLN